MTGIRLVRSGINEHENLVATYHVQHTIPGREGTTLTVKAHVSEHGGAWRAWLEVDDCEGGDPESALKKLASWLRRSAAGIRHGLEDASKRGPALPLGSRSVWVSKAEAEDHEDT